MGRIKRLYGWKESTLPNEGVATCTATKVLPPAVPTKHNYYYYYYTIVLLHCTHATWRVSAIQTVTRLQIDAGRNDWSKDTITNPLYVLRTKWMDDSLWRKAATISFITN